jgi:hypothetical protein
MREELIRTYLIAAQAATPAGRELVLKLARRAMTEAEYTTPPGKWRVVEDLPKTAHLCSRCKRLAQAASK